MSNIKQFFDKDGNDIFPVTHASAVFDDEGKNILENLEEKKTELEDSIKNNVENVFLMNDVFAINKDDVYYVQLEDGEDLAYVINNAFSDTNIKMVAVPPGKYIISQTIEIPAQKTLLLSGGATKDDYGPLINYSKDTVLFPSNIDCMVIMHSGAKLKGGVFWTRDYNQDIICVRLDFYNEKHSYTTVDMTKMFGNRNYSQTAVLMECDDPNGVIKQGYGVFCNFNAAIYYFNIGYYLHRHNATDSDGPGEVVWCTQNMISGNITHCNRYIWYDTFGGWGGDTSIITATIQAGSPVGEDVPGLEFNCGEIVYSGVPWDFGGEGLQQIFVKLNAKARKCVFHAVNRDRTVVDNGENNIFLYELANATKYISDSIINSIEGNEDSILVDFSTRLNGVQSDTKNYEELRYEASGMSGTFNNDATVSGCEFLLNKYPVTNTTRLNMYELTTRFRNCDVGIITLTFPCIIGMRKIAFNITERSYPKNINIYIVTHKDQKVLLHSKYLGDTQTYASGSNHQQITFDIADALSKNGLIPKQRVIRQLIIELEGGYDNNSHGEFGICNLQIQTDDLFYTPTVRQLRYLYDIDNFVCMSKSGTKIYGDPVIDIDFSNTDKTVDDVQTYLTTTNGTLELKDGHLNVYSTDTSESAAGTYLFVRSNYIAAIELDITNTLSTGIYTIGYINSVFINNAHRQGYSSYRIFNLCGDSIIQPIGGTKGGIPSDNPVRIKRLVIYNKIKPKHLPEIFTMLNGVKY